MIDRELTITIHPDIIFFCLMLLRNKDFDFSSDKKDSVTLVSENTLLNDQKKYMYESIPNLESTNTIYSPFDDSLNHAVTSLFLSEGNDTDHKISFFSKHFSDFIEKNDIRFSEHEIELFLKDLIAIIFEPNDAVVFEKYPLLNKYFSSNENILFLFHTKKLFHDFLKNFLSLENEIHLPQDFIKTLLSQIPYIYCKLYDEYSVNLFEKNLTTKNPRINQITSIQKSISARKGAFAKAEKEKKAKEALKAQIISAYEKRINSREFISLNHFYTNFTVSFNYNIKKENPNISEKELDALLIKEGTVRKILTGYRKSKK